MLVVAKNRTQEWGLCWLYVRSVAGTQASWPVSCGMCGQWQPCHDGHPRSTTQTTRSGPTSSGPLA